MQLNVNDTIVAKAGATDINRAFAARPLPDGLVHHARRRPAPARSTRCCNRTAASSWCRPTTHGRREADADAATAKAVFQKFLAHDASWRKACDWRETGGKKSGAKKSGAQKSGAMKFMPDRRPIAGRAGNQPPRWTLVTLTAVIGAVMLIVLLAQVNRGLLRAIVPFSDSGLFWVALIAVPFVTLITVAIVSKLAEFRQAATWTQTTGRVLRSGVGTQRRRFGNEPETVVNVPAIEYEFTVDGRVVRGRRVAIGEDPTGVNTAAAVARYPAGADVTVFYDPADPANCVLERDPPMAIAAPGVPNALASVAALLVALIASVYALLTRGPAFVAAHFPKAAPHPELPVYILCFALGALAFALAFRRSSKQAAGWPSVPGKILRSETEMFRQRIGNDPINLQNKLYRPVVEYAYAVRGLDYRGSQIKLMTVLSGTQNYAEKLAAKYPVGAAVAVHYDPANPGSAALENPTGLWWLLLAVAGALVALAAYTLGLFA